MAWKEDAWSGSPEITVLNNDVDHKADLIVAMQQALKENNLEDTMGIYSSIECIPQFLSISKFVSIKDWANVI
ncbi:hypothetical protein [Photobacterium sp. GB-72]|uniref:hypothetical protein n=1 Tax=Photobacterium sp. GB-72 TaxID=2022105 RepID=UPI000D161EAC|nr:hypothetical protein [Photobacterium sp. GB-72]PSV27660.1 hypothetical protein C9J40_20200 [Photobacterium sp. GB-72]